MALQGGFVTIHHKGIAFRQGGDVERVSVREPVERGAVPVYGGVALLLAHHDGVGQSHRRVGQEEEVGGGAVRGEVVDMTGAM